MLRPQSRYAPSRSDWGGSRVIAAQSIGEPGTQLTLRTFHAGGVAGSENTNRSIVVKEEEAIVELSSDLRAIVIPGQDYRVIASRESEIFLYHPESHNLLKTYDLQYGSKLHCKTGDKVVKGQTLAEWDPFNSVVVAETAGTLEYVNLEEGVNYKDTVDATSGYHDVMVIESKEKSKLPELKIVDPATGTEKLYSLPAGCRLTFNPKTKGKMQVNPGDELYKIPRVLASAGDITGGLPRVTELFEARNPSNPAILSEIDGVVEIGKIKRNNREVSVTSRLGEVRISYPYSKAYFGSEWRRSTCRYPSLRWGGNSERHSSDQGADGSPRVYCKRDPRRIS